MSRRMPTVTFNNCHGRKGLEAATRLAKQWNRFN